MGVMHMQLWEVTLEHDALHEEFAACQIKCLGRKQDVIDQQKIIKKGNCKGH
jgi:hypothetical protein